MNWSKYVSGAVEVTSALSTMLFTALTVAIGVIFIYRAVKKIADHGKGGNPHERPFGYIAINMATGAALLQFAFFVDAVIMSFFGEKAQSPSAVLSYLPPSVATAPILNAGVMMAAMWVSVIGIISIIRGIVLWNSLANQGGQNSGAGWKGLWHIVFGILTANVGGFVKALSG